jgi:hypothetical protein
LVSGFHSPNVCFDHSVTLFRSICPQFDEPIAKDAAILHRRRARSNAVGGDMDLIAALRHDVRPPIPRRNADRAAHLERAERSASAIAADND